MVDNCQRIIAFSGAHGTGKTMDSYSKVIQIKLSFPELSVGHVVDIERRCRYLINKEASPETQLYLFASQIAEELEALSQFDLVVTDHTVFDFIAYTLQANYLALGNSMMALAQQHARRYRRIIFHDISQHQYLFDDGTRDTDPAYQKEIQDKLITIYARINLLNDPRFKRNETPIPPV